MSDHAEELRCECCGGQLRIVCTKNDCADPLETRRKSNGPVPAALKTGERRKPLPAEKRCTRCLKVKPFGEFYLRRGRPFPNCKGCWNEYTAARTKAKAVTS